MKTKEDIRWLRCVPQCLESLEALLKELDDRVGPDGWQFDWEHEGRWYPVRATWNREPYPRSPFLPVSTLSTEQVRISVFLTWAGNVSGTIPGLPSERLETNTDTMDTLLSGFGLRLHNATLDKEYREAQDSAAEMQLRTGHALALTGRAEIQKVSMFGPYLTGRKAQAGLRTVEERVVVDGETGSDANANAKEGAEKYRMEYQRNFAPIIRAFSLSQKQWVYVDVRATREPEWDDTAMERVVLPSETRDILTRVLAADVRDVPGDIMAGKHGGLSILAAGGPGIGKTLTAEAMAEQLHVALYFVDSRDLRGSEDDIEVQLETLFTRAAAWRCILLFDEVDVFLKRRANDFRHNKVVAAFLRLMDHFRGILFCTTNREDMIDQAFASRIGMCIRYPALDDKARTHLWQNMLELANVRLEGAAETLAAQYPMNGREIRNAVRLLRVLYHDEPVSLDAAGTVCEHRVGSLHRNHMEEDKSCR